MALTLRDAITANQTTFDVLGGDDLQSGDFKTIDSETIVIRTAKAATLGYGETARYRVSALRGANGSRAAAHDASATLAAFSGGGGGGVSVTGAGGEGPFPATTLQAGIATDTGGGSVGMGSVIVSETDPGAIGAGNMWLRADPDEASAPVLYVRNAADDGWADQSGSGYVTGNGLTFYGNDDLVKTKVTMDALAIYVDAPAAQLRVGSGESYLRDTAAITLDGNSGDPGLDYIKVAVTGISVFTQETVTINAGGDTLILDGTGVLMFNGSPVGTQAAHVADGSTVDQLRDALIAAGLMAAS